MRVPLKKCGVKKKIMSIKYCRRQENSQSSKSKSHFLSNMGSSPCNGVGGRTRLNAGIACSKKASLSWWSLLKLPKRLKTRKLPLPSHPSKSLAYPKTRPPLISRKCRAKARKREIWNSLTKIMISTTIALRTRNLSKK